MNFSVLEPCVEPKPVPVIVTEIPGLPNHGEIFAIVGDCEFETVMVVDPQVVPAQALIVAEPVPTAKALP